MALSNQGRRPASKWLTTNWNELGPEHEHMLTAWAHPHLSNERHGQVFAEYRDAVTAAYDLQTGIKVVSEVYPGVSFPWGQAQDAALDLAWDEMAHRRRSGGA